MILIVDYNVGNLASICNMLKKIGAQDVVVSKDPGLVAQADRLLLPGVGSFDTAAQSLRASGLLPALEQRVLGDRVPLLGICLGMQLFMDGSEEGSEPGLGWIPGQVMRFRQPQGSMLKVPHMGWNTVTANSTACLFRNMDEETAYYFVHSYHVECSDQADVLATTRHGYDFPCAVRRGNIMGTQFHPEKSHRHGMQVLRNFLEAAC